MKKSVWGAWALAGALCLALSAGASEAIDFSGVTEADRRITGQVQLPDRVLPLYIDAELPEAVPASLPVVTVTYRKLGKDEVKAGFAAIGQDWDGKGITVSNSRDTCYIDWWRRDASPSAVDLNISNPYQDVTPDEATAMARAEEVAETFLLGMGLPREGFRLTAERYGVWEPPVYYGEEHRAKIAEQIEAHRQGFLEAWGYEMDSVSGVRVEFLLNGMPVYPMLSWNPGWSDEPSAKIGSGVGGIVRVSDSGQVLGFTLENFPDIAEEQGSVEVLDWRADLQRRTTISPGEDAYDEGIHPAADPAPYDRERFESLGRNVLLRIYVEYESHVYKTYTPRWAYEIRWVDHEEE